MTTEKITYNTYGTCCKVMNIELEDGKINDVEFIGGCNGNLKGIANLIKGLSPEEVISKLKGIRCGAKETSCPDQLAQCLTVYLQEKTKTTANV